MQNYICVGHYFVSLLYTRLSHNHLERAPNLYLSNSSTTVRNMDKSGRGHLTNEKVYNLMQEQLSMQKSLFQMKKVIAG